MTWSKPDSHPDQRHQEVWELLPWYVNRTLEAQELAHVEQHLARCPACQEEVTRFHHIATAVRLAEEPTPSPSPARFARLMAQIDATEAVGQPTRRRWATLRHKLRRYGALFSGTPRVARVMLAVEGALVLLLAAVLVWQAQSVQDASYTTLARPSVQDALARPMEHPVQPRGQIRLVVADQMTARELRELLTGLQATIINGPSPLGVYTVAVPLVASTPDPLQPILEVFRAHPHVLLAERASAP
jgi:anti-sigma factor RsiW